MRFIYNILFAVLGFFYIPFLFFKQKVHKDFMQRFGCLPDDLSFGSRPVWIHAVSVGEVMLALKMIKIIRHRDKDVKVAVSTTTSTGYQLLTANKDGSTKIFYSPLDFSFIVSSFIEKINPSVYVIVETELWPNCLDMMRSNNVTVILANGRISDASFRNYSIIKPLTRKMLANITFACMQTQRDLDRICALGLERDRAVVTGSMKFDRDIPDGTGESKINSSLTFHKDELVLIAGSTHFPEEEMILDLYKDIKGQFSTLKLVLAPRHVERKTSIEDMIKSRGLEFSSLSGILTGEDARDKDVVLVDTIGHLNKLYNSGTIIFIGKSLMAKGGQNPLEGAMCGKLTVFGPHMDNFRDIADELVNKKASVRVKNADELKEVICDLLRDKNKRSRMEKNALSIIRSNRGALDATVDIVIKHYKKK